jgi:hypothetical protein
MVRKRISSDQCFFAVEYFVMIGISDSSLQPQVELLNLMGIIAFQNNDIWGLKDLIVIRWAQEFAARVSILAKLIHEQNVGQSVVFLSYLSSR